jgi:hypothetical protein
MAIKLVTGREPVLAEALSWLESRGLKPTEIRAVSIDAKVGAPLIITVSLIVQDPAEVTPEAVRGFPPCGVDGHPATSHHCRSNGVPVRIPDAVEG